MNKAAFFDIDGTLFRSSLVIEHFKVLTQYEVIDPIIWYKDIKPTYDNWITRHEEYDNYLITLAEGYKKALYKKNINELDFIAKRVITLLGEMVYTYTRDMVKEHLDNGFLVYFISGSPDFLVSKMAKLYNITDYRASTYKVDSNGLFNCEVIPMWDKESKKEAILKIIKDNNINVKKSYAYGDTSGDATMLRMMGNPVAINPSFELLTLLKSDNVLREKTKIIIERKDCIYTLNADVDARSIEVING